MIIGSDFIVVLPLMMLYLIRIGGLRLLLFGR